MERKTYPCELPSFVDSKSVTFEPSNLVDKRFVASFEYNDRNESLKTAIVIMKNPSKSLIGSSFEDKKLLIDESTDNVLSYIYNYKPRYEKEFKRVIILNLFPCYGSNPDIVNTTYSFCDHEYNEDLLLHEDLIMNQKYIVQNIKENANATIICAWGGYGDEGQVIKEYYDQQINKLMTEVMKLDIKISYVSNKGYKVKKPFLPKHGRAWNKDEHLIMTPPRVDIDY